MSQYNNVIFTNIGVTINSKFRENKHKTKTNEFKFNLDKEVRRISMIKIKSIQVPFTFYGINSTNNRLYVNSTWITITPGNYTSNTIGTEIKTQLEAAFGPGVVTVSISPTNHKMTLSIDAGTLEIKYSDGSEISTFAPLIGFNLSANGPPSEIYPVSIGPAASITGNGVVDISGIKYIVVKSNALTRFSGQKNATASSLSSNNILHTITVKGFPTDIILDEPENLEISINNKTTFKNSIDFRLEDDSGNLLDLNGSEWSVNFIFIST